MKNSRELRGQLIVIIALAMIAIVSFTALAVDGSLVYNEKRVDQSVTDSSALAAAGAAAQYLKTSNMSGYACGSTVSAGAASAAISQAMTTASASGITLTANDLSVSGVTTECGTYNGRNYIDVHVVVTTEVQPKFLSLIRDDPIQTAAESVARVYINTTFASGNLIYTTGTACSYSSAPYGGIHATGNGNITVKHGGIFSNSCIQTTGSSDVFVYDGVAQYMGVGTKTFYTGSKKQTTVSNGILPNTNTTAFILNDPNTSSGNSISDYTSQSYQMWSTYSGNSSIPEEFWPTATTQSITADMEDIVLPTCPSTARTFPANSNGTNQTVYPGTYSSAASYGGWGGYTLTFAPGVYCFSSSLSLSGGSDTIIMKDVVLYFTGTGGIFYGGTIKPTMDGSSIFITNGDFQLASGIPLNAENFFVYIASGKFRISGAATGTISSFNTSNSVYAIPGVLVYMGDSNSSNVEINGSGGLVASGTIYAPNSLVNVTGASTSNTMNVQIIGKAVWVSGSGTVNMDADGATLYSQGSTTIQLMR